ncbi:MAG: hypothetical protein ACHQX1_01375 [Candidatus Micrarchaeales archaeon]
MKLEPEPALLLALILISLFALISVYNAQGPGTALISNYLYGKGVTSQYFFTKSFTVTNGTIYSGSTLIQTFSEPVSGFILGAISLVIPDIYHAILIYIILLYFAFVAALYNLAKNLGIDKFIVYAMFLNPFVIYFMFVFGSNEILSSIFLILAISYIVKGSSKSGLLMGLANLSSYATLLFLPLLIFVEDKKKVLLAFAFWAVPTLLWMAFNYYYFGNPFFGYYRALINLVFTLGKSQLYLESLISVLIYPVLYGILFSFLYFTSKAYVVYGRVMKRPGIGPIQLPERAHAAAYAAVVLAIIGFLIIQPGFNSIQQTIAGFLIVISFIMMFAILTGETVNRLGSRLSYPVPMATLAISVIVMLGFVYYYYTGLTYNEAAYNIENVHSVYANAISELGALNLSNCRIVSNAWIDMRYLNVSAYSYLYPNSTSFKYPIVDFSSDALKQVPFYYVQNETNVRYSNINYSIFVPRNYSCYS